MSDAECTVKERFLARIADRTAHVGVIGLGYVGLPLAVEFARAGFRVVGIDLDLNKCAEVNAGRSYVGDVASGSVAPLVASGKLHATDDYAALAEVDAVAICVPTPLGKAKDPDISYVVAASDALAEQVHAGMLVVLESTTYPGTTEEILLPGSSRTASRWERISSWPFLQSGWTPGTSASTLATRPRLSVG